MKTFITTLMITCLFTAGITAQNVPAQFDEARSAYSAGDLQGARFALQQAINEIDKAIGAEILKILPTNLESMTMVEAEDNVTAASLGYAGLYVSRNYKADDKKSASIQIISDSPFLAGVNALLALPMFGSDPNQKRIRVGSNRAILQRSQDETGIVSWDIQIPFGSNLLTFNCKGFESEKAVTDLANLIPVDQIAKLAQ